MSRVLRRDDVQDYIELLSDTWVLEQETSFLLRGDYGEEAYHEVCRNVDPSSRRRNNVAMVGQMLAKYACGVRSDHARKAYNSLTEEVQDKANETISNLIGELIS